MKRFLIVVIMVLSILFMASCQNNNSNGQNQNTTGNDEKQIETPIGDGGNFNGNNYKK